MSSPSKSPPLKRKYDHLETTISPLSVQVQHDPLCERCGRIDFETVLNFDWRTLMQAGKAGILIERFGQRLTRALSQTCALCQLFAKVAVPPLDTKGHTDYELRAYSFLQFSRIVLYQYYKSDLEHKIGNKDQPYLAVVSSRRSEFDLADETAKVGQIFCYSTKETMQRLFSPRIIPPYLKSSSYSSVMQWIKYCRRHHTKLCGKKERQLDGLKVFDCEYMCVVPAPPSCLYVALSYVWGEADGMCQRAQPDFEEATNSLPPPLPKTIEDAITVTKNLGFRYLWFDERCINQVDLAEKKYQIKRMDAIYSAAEITIIAAAGKNKDFGLPGVGARPRIAQPKATIRDIQVVSSMMHPHLAIESSTWAERGWTFQEGVLSLRRLVFTPEQIYFECDAMNCCESLCPNLDLLHTRNKRETHPLFHKGIIARRQRNPSARFNGNNVTRRAAWDRYRRLIEDCSGRDLTNPEDIEGAFAGTAKNLARSDPPFFHVHGIPFPMPLERETPSDDRTHLARSLLWVHKKDSSPSRRRPGFPSWSWTGWFGGVSFVHRKTLFMSKLFGIWFEFETGLVVEQSDFLRGSQLDELHSLKLRALHFDTLVASPDLLVVENTLPTLWRFAQGKASVQLSLGRVDSQHILEMLSTQKWVLAVIGVGYHEREVIYLLVLERASDCMTRVGVITVTFHKGADVDALLTKLKRDRIKVM